jgi:hypothetical protein
MCIIHPIQDTTSDLRIGEGHKLRSSSLLNFLQLPVTSTALGPNILHNNRLNFHRKNWEYGRDLFLVFIDYEKASDSIDRSKIWSCLTKLKISPGIVNRIKQTYEITTNCVKINMGKTGWFETKGGVRQGSILSPILFNVIMNEICLKMKEKNRRPESISVCR